MQKIGILSFIVLSATAIGRPATAANSEMGSAFARQWCANCHVVGEPAPGTVQQGPPSFRSVARSGLSNDQLRAFLSHPHGAMPDLTLSRAEIDDLLAYIASLR